MKIFCVISVFLSVLVCVPLSAQTVKDAEKLFNSGNYNEAFGVYEKLIKTDGRDKMLRYKAARALISANRYEEAIPYLRFAADRNVVMAHYYLYIAFFETYRFEQSADAMDMYLQLTDGKIDNYEECELASKKARQAADMLSRMEEIIIVDSIKTHKSKLLDFYRLSTELGALTFLSDKQHICYYTGRKDKRIFAGKGKNGDTDLMISYRILDGWSEAVGLSDVINTGLDENYPFELSDGVTFYFASKGHGSIGGYDIFMSRYNSISNEYTVPVNIGMPFNSPANDYMMVIDEMAHIGWFATDRFQHPDSVVVYEFIPASEKQLLGTDNEEYRRLAAQLKVYRKAKDEEFSDSDINDIDMPDKERTEINFLVDDGIVYTSLDQFRSEDAKALYIKFLETDKRLKTLLILLEGKRREFLFSSSESDKIALRTEILALEDDVVCYTDLVYEYILQTRRAELSVIYLRQ